MKWLGTTFLQQYYVILDNRSRTLGYGHVIQRADALLIFFCLLSKAILQLYMQIDPTFILEVCPKKAACTELDFCKVMKILDQVHTLLKRTFKGSLWHTLHYKISL